MTDAEKYAAYEKRVQDEIQSTGRMPHCDQNVLHEPAMMCEYCNKHPDLQAFRLQYFMAFTGERNSLKIPCPAEVRRPLDKIEQWGGNTLHSHTYMQGYRAAMVGFPCLEQDPDYILGHQDGLGDLHSRS